jgi:integrase
LADRLAHRQCDGGCGPYTVSPFDFGRDQAPSPGEARALIQAMRTDVYPYRPTADRTRTRDADLFERVSDRTRVPDETLIPWYRLYEQVRFAARRVRDPYTGALLYFSPHCFRHSFATALAPLIGGDAKTGAKIMGHSAQTFMRYVRANDETARAAVEKMVEGVPVMGEPASVPVRLRMLT